MLKQDKILIKSMVQTIKSQTDNVRNYQYYKNKQEEITMKVQRYQKFKEKEDELKDKFDTKIEVENKKAYDLKSKLEKLEEKEIEYMKRLENTLIRNRLEIDTMQLNKTNNCSFADLKVKGNFNSISAGNTKMSSPTNMTRNSAEVKFNFGSCPIKLETIYDGENEENEYLLTGSEIKKEPHKVRSKYQSTMTRVASQKTNPISNINLGTKNEGRQINGAEIRIMKKHNSVAVYDFDNKISKNNYSTQENNSRFNKITPYSITETDKRNNKATFRIKNKPNVPKDNTKLNERPEWKDIKIKNKDVNSSLSIKIGTDKENVARKIDFGNYTPKTTKNSSVKMTSK